MENVYFKSVTVESAHPGKLRNISSVATAAEFLLNEWPGKRGRLHGLARQACLEAMDGTGTGDIARSAFLDAATEANIYVENTSWVHY
ncbi:MAG: DUF982 domain-containing protein [Phyllobacterium sp.]|jgi:hypothetical protein|uniref:DUF982 domain-containing protein n=1 Tax=Phyllobacterium sp. TaxID=1871046 RepID=UPI0030EFD550